MTTQRAPEPTMDEILASIKRIIADEDDSASGRGNGGGAMASPHKHDGLKPFSVSDDGDEQLIDDIARALNHAGNDGVAEDDDILDLTRVMTEQIEAESAVDPKTADAGMDDPFELGSALRDPPSGAFPEAPQTGHGFADDDIFSLDNELSDELREIGKTEERLRPDELNADEHLHADIEALDIASDTRTSDAWTLNTATRDEPSAEIFELPRAEPDFGEPVFSSETEPPFDMAANPPDDVLDDNAKMLSAIDASTAEPKSGDIKFDEVFGGAAVSESVPGDLNPAPATDAIWEPVTEQASAPVTPPGSALMRMPEAPEPAWAEATAPVGQALGGKSMEDSVKEMLRPMLREWLNENMPRILESALRDELQKASLPDA